MTASGVPHPDQLAGMFVKVVLFATPFVSWGVVHVPALLTYPDTIAGERFVGFIWFRASAPPNPTACDGYVFATAVFSGVVKEFHGVPLLRLFSALAAVTASCWSSVFSMLSVEFVNEATRPW